MEKAVSEKKPVLGSIAANRIFKRERMREPEKNQLEGDILTGWTSRGKKNASKKYTVSKSCL